MMDMEDFKVIFRRLILLGLVGTIISAIVFVIVQDQIWLIGGLLLSWSMLAGFLIFSIYYAVFGDSGLLVTSETYKAWFGKAERKNNNIAQKSEAMNKRRRQRPRM